ncbi:CBO0543 family protein [Bacillus sp. AFS040349]|uniref:CBO0543 family protein n=1 Tax=Bacillus sp. AFS040349 TaxID=2033502 RepID=UPI000BFBA2F3|nr:CBO0543 family protein [Bacillus sp. AFS040349]PGT88881.1 hypothetical protein COD11_05335 [Bacillus sp. AFS040349]
MNTPTYEDILKINENLNNTSFSHWYHDDLFTVTWWFLLLSTIGPFIVWNKFRDRNRSLELILFGLISSLLASFLDEVGIFLGLWGYPDKLIPIIPPLVPADVAVIPVFSMLIYQYSPTLTSYIWKYIIFAGILAFMIEPAFVKFDMYAYHKWWTHTCSFIGLILYGLIIYYFIRFILTHFKKADHSF